MEFIDKRLSPGRIMHFLRETDAKGAAFMGLRLDFYFAFELVNDELTEV